jgi:hypothetical protein
MNKQNVPPKLTMSKHRYTKIIPEKIYIDETSNESILKIVINKECNVGTSILKELVPYMNTIIFKRQEQLKTIFDEYNDQKGFLWFLYDIKQFCKYYGYAILKEKENLDELLNINKCEDLFHNRNVGHTLYIYDSNGLNVEILKRKKSTKVTDLRVNNINVEIKTIQPIRNIRILKNGIFLGDNDRRSFISAFHTRIVKAVEQSNTNGCVLLFVWCNLTNKLLIELLKGYYDKDFPTPKPGKVNLIYRDPDDNNIHYFSQFSFDSYSENIDKLDTILKQSLPLKPRKEGEIRFIDLSFNPKGIDLVLNCNNNPGLNLNIFKGYIDPELIQN